MNAQTFHLIFAVTYLSVIGIRIVGRVAAAQPGGAIDYKESRGSVALLRAFSTVMIGATVVYILSPGWFDWASFWLPTWARWSGAALMIAAVPLIGWAQWALGKNFATSLHARADHALVTHGPYRRLRHPMYSFTALFNLGTLLTSANGLIGVPPMIALAIIVLTRVEKEEALMIERFGDAYRAYMRTTGRFWPRIRSR